MRTLWRMLIAWLKAEEERKQQALDRIRRLDREAQERKDRDRKNG